MSSTLTDMVNWLKSWFYTETEVDTLLASKQDTLVSGSNLKTVNGNSLLGSGNVVIEGGGTGVDIVTDWEDPTSDLKVASEKLTKDTLDTKQDLLISGSTIKTINNQSVLGSGNIDIQGGGGTNVVMVGSFMINEDGDLIVTLPTGTVNPYHIDENGDLIYSTNPQIEEVNNG